VPARRPPADPLPALAAWMGRHRARIFRLALSGGLDSMALLEALLELRRRGGLPAPLACLHVHHGLRPEAGAWARLVAGRCAEAGLPCEVLRVRVDPGDPRGLEAAAREARYAALAARLSPGEALLTGHHRDDQAETVLLQLLRGAGPAGLAAMAGWRPFGPGRLGRPWLDLGWGRAELEAWARARGLGWVEDPTNRDPRHLRNRLRHELLPRLEALVPGARRTLARAARLQAEAAALLEELAAQDLERAAGPEGALRLEALAALSEARRRNLLRHWLRLRGAPPLDERRLEELARWAGLRPDARPCLRWRGWELRRHRGLLRVRPVPPPLDPGLDLPWTPPEPLALPDGRRLCAEARPGGLRPGLGLRVRLRRGGERMVCKDNGMRRPLKKLLQEWGVPPWERERLPLLYAGEELAAVTGLGVAAPFRAPPGEAGWWPVVEG